MAGSSISQNLLVVESSVAPARCERPATPQVQRVGAAGLRAAREAPRLIETRRGRVAGAQAQPIELASRRLDHGLYQATADAVAAMHLEHVEVPDPPHP